MLSGAVLLFAGALTNGLFISNRQALEGQSAEGAPIPVGAD
jgi:hypothetical protein